MEAPRQTLSKLTGLVVIDEIQLKPELFPLLRVLADRERIPARFLILGSASPQLVKSVSESLAGRVGFVDLSGFDGMEDLQLERLYVLYPGEKDYALDVRIEVLGLRHVEKLAELHVADG